MSGLMMACELKWTVCGSVFHGNDCAGMKISSENEQTYSIEEHQHRLAAWAAGRAAVRGVRGATVKNLRALLEDAGIDPSFTVSKLEETPVEFGVQHRSLCAAIISSAALRGFALSYGQAAKLLNIYLKVRFVCGPDHQNRCVRHLHPPIDRELLKYLAAKNVGGFSKEWVSAKSKGWSKFSQADYESVIERIRTALGGAPLWSIEEYWPGLQQ
jgi:hypothetical protein